MAFISYSPCEQLRQENEDSFSVCLPTGASEEQHNKYRVLPGLIHQPLQLERPERGMEGACPAQPHGNISDQTVLKFLVSPNCRNIHFLPLLTLF